MKVVKTIIGIGSAMLVGAFLEASCLLAASDDSRMRPRLMGLLGFERTSIIDKSDGTKAIGYIHQYDQGK